MRDFACAGTSPASEYSLANTLLAGGPGSGPRPGENPLEAKVTLARREASEHTKVADAHSKMASEFKAGSKSEEKHSDASEAHDAAAAHYTKAAASYALGNESEGDHHFAKGRMSTNSANRLSDRTPDHSAGWVARNTK